jgi:hypothetical protein
MVLGSSLFRIIWNISDTQEQTDFDRFGQFVLGDRVVVVAISMPGATRWEVVGDSRQQVA